MAPLSFSSRMIPTIQAFAPKDAAAALAPDGPFDAVVLVIAGPFNRATPKALGALRRAVDAAQAADASLFGKAPRQIFFPVADLAGGRLVIATTGDLTHDTSDVRSFADAGAAGVARACQAGARRPVVVVGPAPREPRYRRAVATALLGALGAMWKPLEARAAGKAGTRVTRVGIVALGGADADEVRIQASRLEAARFVTRDLAGTDPEQMNPERFAEYCVQTFTRTPVKVTVTDQPSKIRKGYPLLNAVCRASLGIRRHAPRIIRLEYHPPGKIERTLWFAGKGVTYDTGGADIKAGGAMAGMSRDKGGAAAVAGFFQLLAASRPKGLRAVALIGAVRNSVGSEAYVTDEIITSRAGVRVRIGNTDAEGRLVLADLLAALAEEAKGAPQPAIFSLATLTGHSHRAVGEYTILMGNGAACRANLPVRIQASGEEWGDPCEVSTIRRDDYAFIAPRSAAEDVISCNSAPSTGTARGHQFPFAFLDIASGIQGTNLPFVHIDLGGSAMTDGDWQFGTPTAAPVVALVESLLG